MRVSAFGGDSFSGPPDNPMGLIFYFAFLLLLFMILPVARALCRS